MHLLEQELRQSRSSLKRFWRESEGVTVIEAAQRDKGGIERWRIHSTFLFRFRRRRIGYIGVISASGS